MTFSPWQNLNTVKKSAKENGWERDRKKETKDARRRRMSRNVQNNRYFFPACRSPLHFIRLFTEQPVITANLLLVRNISRRLTLHLSRGNFFFRAPRSTGSFKIQQWNDSVRRTSFISFTREWEIVANCIILLRSSDTHVLTIFQAITTLLHGFKIVLQIKTEVLVSIKKKI